MYFYEINSKKMKTLITFIISFLSVGCFAQVPEPATLWLREYGGGGFDEIVNAVTKTSDGGFIVCISTNSSPGFGNIDSLCTGDTINSENIFLKYNSDATILEWTKCNGIGSYINILYDNSFIFGGVTTAVPSGWAFDILKQNNTGLILWSKTYGGQNAGARLKGMIACDDGGYIMVGETNYSDTDFTIHYGSFMDDDIAVVKVDSNGNKVWAKVIGGSQEDAVEAVIAAPGDGCYIVGSTNSTDFDCTGSLGNGDIYLARLDKSGTILWHRDIGGSGGEFAANATSNGKGGVIIAGATSSPDGDRTHFPPFGCPIWVLEVDSNQNILWNNCYGGGGGNCYPNAICKAIDGSIWIAAVSDVIGYEVDTNYGRDDAWFVHTDSVGNLLCAKVLGGSGLDEGTMVYPLSNGSIIAGGYYQYGNGGFPNIGWGGFGDAFLTVFAPWTTGITSLEVNNHKTEIYPNPTNKEVTIETEQNGINNLLITDLLGRLIYTTQFANKIQISIIDWPKGIYYVQIMDNNGYKKVEKLIIQ